MRFHWVLLVLLSSQCGLLLGLVFAKKKKKPYRLKTQIFINKTHT
jgi:hypothetical protein